MKSTQFYEFLDKYGLGHILEGGIFYIIILLLTQSSIYACIFILAFYFSRERRDYEVKLNLSIAEWYKGWDIWNWDLMDLIPVSVFYTLITIAINIW